MSDERPNILDLVPRLRARKLRECPHARVEVDPYDPILECADCNAVIDPYVYLRELADEGATEDAHRREAFEKWKSWVATANARLADLNAEIARLTKTKNRLWNEQVNGRPLGTLARRTRRKRMP